VRVRVRARAQAYVKSCMKFRGYGYTFYVAKVWATAFLLLCKLELCVLTRGLLVCSPANAP
jgi:hypothetical protein